MAAGFHSNQARTHLTWLIQSTEVSLHRWFVGSGVFLLGWTHKQPSNDTNVQQYKIKIKKTEGNKTYIIVYNQSGSLNSVIREFLLIIWVWVETWCRLHVFCSYRSVLQVPFKWRERRLQYTVHHFCFKSESHNKNNLNPDQGLKLFHHKCITVFSEQLLLFSSDSRSQSPEDNVC